MGAAATAETIPIPEEFRSCARDSDCKVIASLCGCCVFAAINKKSTAEYFALEKTCKAPPPPCKCEEKFTAVCERKRCVKKELNKAKVQNPKSARSCDTPATGAGIRCG